MRILCGFAAINITRRKETKDMENKEQRNKTIPTTVFPPPLSPSNYFMFFPVTLLNLTLKSSTADPVVPAFVGVLTYCKIKHITPLD
jgi:hypothetical protein